MKDLHLSALDQTVLRVYIRHLLFFEFPDIIRANEAVAALKYGLKRTLDQVPFLAGKIGPKDDHHRLKLEYPTAISEDILNQIFTEKLDDVENPQLDYKNLKESGFPPSRLLRDIFCPKLLLNHPGLDDSFAEGMISFKEGKPVPVLAAQANFIPGGMVLSVYANHTAIDGMGLKRVYEAWSMHISERGGLLLNNDVATKEEYSGHKICDWKTQRGSLDELGVDAKVCDCPEIRIPGTPSPHVALRGTPYSVSANILVLRADRLSKLQLSLGSNISVFTIMAALLWTRITHVRETKLKDKNIDTTKLCLAFDHRRNLEPRKSQSFLGNCATGILISSPVAFTSSSRPDDQMQYLGDVVNTITKSLQTIDLNWLKPRLGVFATTPNPHHLGLHMDLANGPDLFITSWMSLGPDCEWNIPGTRNSKPDAIRKPVSRIEGMIHVLPKRKYDDVGNFDLDSEYEVLVCLEKGEMDSVIRTLQDEGFLARVVDA